MTVNNKLLDYQYKDLANLIEETSLKCGESRSRTKKIIKSFLDVTKDRLEAGWAVRLLGLMDAWPEEKGTEMVYRMKPSSTLKRPRIIRRRVAIQIENMQISDAELLGR